MTTTIKKLVISDPWYQRGTAKAEGGAQAQSIVDYLADPQGARHGDYYADDQDAFMRWIATPWARSTLNVADKVYRAELQALLRGAHPVTGAQIRRGSNGTMVSAIDVTVSPAPKSVSVLWALADAELRYELERMVILAVNRAVGRMLDEVPLARERTGSGSRDLRHVVAKDHIGVQVLHTTSRLAPREGVTDPSELVPDPQLHVHNVLIGQVTDEGKIRAFDSKQIFRYQAELNAEASGHLVAMLAERGFEIAARDVRRENGGLQRRDWELADVPAELLRAMSSRTVEIEELQRAYREETGREPTGKGWEAFLEAHRGPKARMSSEHEAQTWAEIGERYEFGQREAAAYRDAADERRASGVKDRSEAGDAAQEFRGALAAELCREHAYVPEGQLNKVVQQVAVGRIDPYTAGEVLGDMIRDGDVLPLEDGRYTTLAVLAAEQRAGDAAQQLLDAEPEAAPAEADVQATLGRRAAEGRPFDPAQEAAVRIATGGARLVSISGPAGTGKGVSSEAMTEIWHAQGRRVIATAVQGTRTKEAAADAGADLAVNLTALQYRLARGTLRLEPSDVLLVDEAAMVDHDRYADVLEAAARSGATLVQIGDDRQLSAVGPGGLWTTVHEMAAERGQVAQLAEVRRARDPEEARAWAAFREGEIAEGLAYYRERDQLQLHEDRRELREAMVAGWWQSRERWHQADPGERSNAPVMIVDTSNRERDQLNALAQAQRREAGELGEERVELRSRRTVSVGDEVLFNAPYRLPRDPETGRWPAPVTNGTSGRVTEVDTDRQTAVVEVEEPGGQTRRVQVDREAPVELAYARHVSKAQGVTVETAEIAVSDRTTRNELYTMASRSRSGARVHAVAEEVDAEAATAPDETVEAQDRAPDRAQEAQKEPESVPDLTDELRESVRQKRETVTVREIDRSASRPSTKEAIGGRRPLVDRQRASEATKAAWREARQVGQRRDGEAVPEVDRRWYESWTRPERRVAPGSALASGEAAARGERPRPSPSRRESEPMPESLPASDAHETVARGMDQEGYVPINALAHYSYLGQVEFVEDPVSRAIERMRDDPEGVIVVADQEQEQRAREALTREPELAARVEREHQLVRGDVAYRARQETRERWLAQEGAEPHRAEPGAIPRAYVVAGSPRKTPELAWALSAAARSELITTPVESVPDPEPQPYLAGAGGSVRRPVPRGVYGRGAAREVQERTEQIRQRHQLAEMLDQGALPKREDAEPERHRAVSEPVAATVRGSSPTRQLERERDQERHAERTTQPEIGMGKDDDE